MSIIFSVANLVSAYFEKHMLTLALMRDLFLVKKGSNNNGKIAKEGSKAKIQPKRNFQSSSLFTN